MSDANDPILDLIPTANEDKLLAPTDRADALTGRGIIPTTMAQMYALAKVISDSSFAPVNLKSPKDVFLAMNWGMSLGVKNPLVAIQNIAVIKGKPSAYGDLLKAVVVSDPECEDFDEHFTGTFPNDDFTAHCSIKREGIKTATHAEFSIADAKRAVLWPGSAKDPGHKYNPTWYSYPKRMLQMRARAWAIRDSFPDKLMGLAVAEEQGDVIDVIGTDATGETDDLDAVIVSAKARVETVAPKATDTPKGKEKPRGEAPKAAPEPVEEIEEAEVTPVEAEPEEIEIDPFKMSKKELVALIEEHELDVETKQSLADLRQAVYDVLSADEDEDAEEGDVSDEEDEEEDEEEEGADAEAPDDDDEDEEEEEEERAPEVGDTVAYMLDDKPKTGVVVRVLKGGGVDVKGPKKGTVTQLKPGTFSLVEDDDDEEEEATDKDAKGNKLLF